MEIDDLPLAYLPGNSRRVRAKALGEIDLWPRPDQIGAKTEFSGATGAEDPRVDPGRLLDRRTGIHRNPRQPLGVAALLGLVRSLRRGSGVSPETSRHQQ